MDSIGKNANKKVNINVYDTQNNLNVTDSILALDVMKKMDVIIAPSEPKQLERCNEFGKKNNVCIINCFSSKNEDYASTKTVTNNKDDYVPAVMAIYSTDRADGTKNLYKVMKVKFAEGAENVETSDDSGTKFQSVQISGDYEQLIKNGDDVIVLRGVDPTTEDGKALISAWFGSALGGLPAGHYPTTPTNTEEQGG